MLYSTDGNAHEEFGAEGEIDEEQGIVTFTLNEEKEGSFEYQLKVEADGGETYWLTSKIFKTTCGPDSAHI